MYNELAYKTSEYYGECNAKWKKKLWLADLRQSNLGASEDHWVGEGRFWCICIVVISAVFITEIHLRAVSRWAEERDIVSLRVTCSRERDTTSEIASKFPECVSVRVRVCVCVCACMHTSEQASKNACRGFSCYTLYSIHTIMGKGIHALPVMVRVINNASSIHAFHPHVHTHAHTHAHTHIHMKYTHPHPPELALGLPGGILRVMSLLPHPFCSTQLSTTVEVWGETSLSLVLMLVLIEELCRGKKHTNPFEHTHTHYTIQ